MCRLFMTLVPVFCLVQAVVAQHIEVSFDPGPSGIVDPAGSITHYDPDYPEGQFRFTARLVHAGQSIDITNIATWASSEEDVLTSEGGGVFAMVNVGRSFVTASYGGVVSDPMRVTVLGGEGPGARAAARDDSPAVPSETLRQLADSLLAGLDGSGMLDMGGLNDAHNRVEYIDNNDTAGGLLGNRVLRDNGDAEAKWFAPGPHSRLYHMNQYESWYFVVTTQIIVIRNDLALRLHTEPLFRPDGRMGRPAEVLLEEVMHSLFDSLDLHVEEDVEEDALVEVIKIIDNGLEIRMMLDREQLSELDRARLRDMLRNIRTSMQTLTQLLGEENAKRFLDSLGLCDLDENGLPDVFDDWLDDAGIDEEDLAPSGGGGGSGSRYEDFNTEEYTHGPKESFVVW